MSFLSFVEFIKIFIKTIIIILGRLDFENITKKVKPAGK
jgi:hypothetical protein